MEITKNIRDIRQKYQEYISFCDAKRASTLIKKALKNGWSIQDLYLEVLTPAQTYIGSLWQEKSIDISCEHLATEITLQQMYEIRNFFSPQQKYPHKIIVATIENERHTLGARMITDLLQMDGWEADFMGECPPLEDFLHFLKKSPPNLLMISVTLKENFNYVLALMEHLEPFSSFEIVLGGAGVCSIKDKNVHIATAENICEITKNILGVNRKKNEISSYLKTIGTNIQFARKQKGWSQERLAKISKIERTYISSVERGKQNITIGALLKIADALDIKLEKLFS